MKRRQLAALAAALLLPLQYVHAQDLPKKTLSIVVGFAAGGAAELTRAGLLPAPGTRDELARRIDSESKTWGKVITERKITQ